LEYLAVVSLLCLGVPDIAERIKHFEEGGALEVMSACDDDRFDLLLVLIDRVLMLRASVAGAKKGCQ